MKHQINSTRVERVLKRTASDELGSESKKVMVSNQSYEKQVSSIVPKTFAQPKFVSASEVANTAPKNVQRTYEMSDEELLAMTIEFEKKCPQ